MRSGTRLLRRRLGQARRRRSRPPSKRSERRSEKGKSDAAHENADVERDCCLTTSAEYARQRGQSLIATASATTAAAEASTTSAAVAATEATATSTTAAAEAATV